MDLPELGTTLAELGGGGRWRRVVPNSLENAARFPQFHRPGRACSFLGRKCYRGIRSLLLLNPGPGETGNEGDEKRESGDNCRRQAPVSDRNVNDPIYAPKELTHSVKVGILSGLPMMMLWLRQGAARGVYQEYVTERQRRRCPIAPTVIRQRYLD